MVITIYTDGGCHGNPGKGGWAYVILVSSAVYAEAHAEPETTNNRMELTAVIRALERVGDEIDRSAVTSIRIKTDSQYVQKGITQWIDGWVRNGWQTASKKPVKNQDLWRRLQMLSGRYPLTWDWVQAHAGEKINEMCDFLVQTVIKKSS